MNRARGACLDRDQSLLLVVDVQTRLAPHIADRAALVARVGALLATARIFGIPRRLTEHCPGQLGVVVEEVRAGFTDDEIFVKTFFGAAEHEEFVAMLRSTGRSQLVVAGMEAHVCVMQTVLGLLNLGFEVTAVADAIGSRVSRRRDRALALGRMRDAGAILASSETVLFEWTRSGDHAAFREILDVIKALP
ncbi:MAG: isochorismatase family protein [Pseudomonadota bacterium]|nr:isochorismatase family protein [Pseudomonadota bacterium]